MGESSRTVILRHQNDDGSAVPLKGIRTLGRFDRLILAIPVVPADSVTRWTEANAELGIIWLDTRTYGPGPCPLPRRWA